ncbi:MAG: uroporphyrinogen-III synthase [Beijerinckiaceae bacterium]
MRVLVLRPDDGARRTAARLAALGHEAIASPVMETVATGEPPPAGAFDGVIATSAQALRFADPAALQPFLHLPVMCVGARTAQAAREAGFAGIRIEAPDAAQLALDVTQSPPVNRLLYLAGRERKPGLETALKEEGVAVAPWVVYEARALPALRENALNALRRRRVDAALHFSRRSAALFCEQVAAAGLEDEARALLHVAISTDAARGLERLAPSNLRVAASPEEARMLELLA